jgi:hypothetical protein
MLPYCDIIEQMRRKQTIAGYEKLSNEGEANK